MKKSYILPTNLSKLGFRYFRIVLETKAFSRKFIDFVINHPNTGFVFQGHGWSGKKKVLGIGIWATSNAEMIDISNNIRSIIPDSYNIVYQSELTRLEFFTEVNGLRTSILLLDELENKVSLTPLELDYLKLLSTDGSLSLELQEKILNVSSSEIRDLAQKLKNQGVCYEIIENGQLPANYAKYFVDTSALSAHEVNEFSKKLGEDKNCVYIARGNGKYNFEFEYILKDKKTFNEAYKNLLKKSKLVIFDKNLYTNLFPQSKFINIKKIQDKFIELASRGTEYFDLRNSELWYINHEGTKAYLNIYNDEKYKQHMGSGEVALFKELAVEMKEKNSTFNLIDLGSGDGSKARILLEELSIEKIKSYFPVDVQEIELAQAIKNHEQGPYSIHPTILSFQNLSARFPISKKSNEVNIYALLGGTYGNFASHEINSNLKSVLESTKDVLVIGMPISDNLNDEEVLDSYLNRNTEDMGFSVLKQIGFSKQDFEKNPKNIDFIMHLRMEDRRLVAYFILKNTKYILGLKLYPHTKLDVLTSWKPTLAELELALNKDLTVKKLITNKTFALAVCSKK